MAQYCCSPYNTICLAWGGRSFPLAQKVMEHGSATVAFKSIENVIIQCYNGLNAKKTIFIAFWFI